MKQQIYQHLAEHFKLPMENAYQPGTTMMQDEGRKSTASQIVWTLDEHVIIRCNPYYAGQFEALIEAGKALSIEKIANNLDVAFEEEDNIYSITQADFIPHDCAYAIRQLTEDDAEAFTKFHANCSEQDRNQGQVSLEDEVIFGALDGDRIIAVASSFDWHGFVDIGILTDPAYRGQGTGKATVAALTHHYLQDESDTRPLSYRHETSNVGSGKIAKAIGWQHFAVLNFIRFKETESA